MELSEDGLVLSKLGVTDEEFDEEGKKDDFEELDETDIGDEEEEEEEPLGDDDF